MAFSASRDYTESYTAASLIARALKHLGVMDASESVNATEQTDALEQLNLLIKEWSANGADVWVRKTAHMFIPSPGTVTGYTVGTGGTVNLTDTYYVTTLTADSAASDTTLEVTDDTNISDTDIILVELDDGTLHVTTVSGAPSTNVVTLTSGVASKASSGNIVYSYPAANAIADNIVSIVHVSRRLTNTDNAATNAGYMEGIDTPINLIGEQEYRNLTNKYQTGIPTNLYFRQETTNPTISIWPTGGAGNVHSLVVQYRAFIQDFDATTNNIDVPPHGVNALTWCLAAELAAEYGLSEPEQMRLWQLGEKKKNDFFDTMVEGASVIFEADVRR